MREGFIVYFTIGACLILAVLENIRVRDFVRERLQQPKGWLIGALVVALVLVAWPVMVIHALCRDDTA